MVCGIDNAKVCTLDNLPSDQGMGTCTNSDGLEMLGPPMNNTSRIKLIGFKRSGIATRDGNVIARGNQAYWKFRQDRYTI
ncbi:NB-ARC domain-containing protein [Psidium guajava]|nr:NB-ARC domain-containing protein [Psidium guajava]